MNKLINIGDYFIIKYNGNTVHFGQCYDGMTGIISDYFINRYTITLDEKSIRKINEINHRTGASWSVRPTIPFSYVFVYNKSLEIE